MLTKYLRWVCEAKLWDMNSGGRLDPDWGFIGVEWYNVHHHSFWREGDPVGKLKGSIDLSLILEERDSFQWTRTPPSFSRQCTIGLGGQKGFDKYKKWAKVDTYFSFIKPTKKKHDFRGARQFPVNNPSSSCQWVIGGKKICRHKTCREEKGAGVTRHLWKHDSNTETAFGEVLHFPARCWWRCCPFPFSKRSCINPFQAPHTSPSPFSGVRVRGLSLYELSQLWQIVIFVAMGGDASSLKFKSILPRWQSADFARTRLKPVSSFTAAPAAAGKGKGKGAGKDLENGNGNQQPSADKSFYENLPFHGLKSPPKQVRSTLSCIFAFFIWMMLRFWTQSQTIIWTMRTPTTKTSMQKVQLVTRLPVSKLQRRARGCELWFFILCKLVFFLSLICMFYIYVNFMWPYKGVLYWIACGFTIHFICVF